MSDGETRPKTYRVVELDEGREDMETVLNCMADEGYAFVQMAKDTSYDWRLVFVRREIF